MKYSQITSIHGGLRIKAMEKEAGFVTKALGKAVMAPFKALHGVSKAVAPSGFVGQNVIAPVTTGAAIIGSGAAAKSGINKAKGYNRGFDPRLMQVSRSPM